MVVVGKETKGGDDIIVRFAVVGLKLIKGKGKPEGTPSTGVGIKTPLFMAVW